MNATNSRLSIEQLSPERAAELQRIARFIVEQYGNALTRVAQ